MDIKNIEFPTEKPHISFSEIKNWKECPYRHKLLYIDKIESFEESPYLHFGTAVHAGCESLIETKTVDQNKILTEMKEAWKKADFENPEWYSKQPGWYKHEPVETWENWAKNTWGDVLEFLNTEFPGWSCFNAEEDLYENIPEIEKPLYFKGFIDGVLKVPKKRGAGHVYWIIDWKTAGPRGWSRDKKQDLGMTAQLILYKYFWSMKHNIPLKDIRCGFILLKRGSKPGKICSLVPVSVGDKTLDKGVKLMKNMISSVRRGMYLKNRNSCQYCPFLNTEHCK
jgi:hypothetical protein